MTKKFRKKIRKRFRCGRVVLTSNGKIKKLGLANGGGSRFCEWTHGYMNFDDVRDRLIKLYNLGDTESEISLYDFQLHPLDLEQYNTVWKYARDNGLNCNSTIIYLCTREEVDTDQPQKKVKKKKKEKHSPTASIEYKPVIKIEPESDSKQIDLSLVEYSFKNATDDMVKYLRNLISQDIGDGILIELFEHTCIMHGHVCSIIEPSQRNQFLQSRNCSGDENDLKDIESICQTIDTLMNSHKEKLNQLEHFSMMNTLFASFHRNLKNLRDQWIQSFEPNNESDQASSSFVRTTSTDTHPKRPDQETCAVFQPLLNTATDLLDVMNSSSLTSFRTMVKWLITDLEFVRSKVNLYNYQSLADAKQAVTSLKIRYFRKFNDEALESPVHQFTRPTKQAHQKTIRAICDLLSSLRQHQSQIDEHDQSSSSKRRREQSEDNQSSRPKRIKSEKVAGGQENQIDTAIFSSSDI